MLLIKYWCSIVLLVVIQHLCWAHSNPGSAIIFPKEVDDDETANLKTYTNPNEQRSSVKPIKSETKNDSKPEIKTTIRNKKFYDDDDADDNVDYYDIRHARVRSNCKCKIANRCADADSC